ncbi:MAG: purine-binding chemotaxis protein CheW [Planctomycetes bacterium]|nr:purine-binding chemotaxis protein CheW [Planctomycetota bacterium]
MIDIAGSSRQYCTFRLAQYHCGIDVLAVHEILRHQPMTRVPLAPPVVKGLINLRGQIITALDMRTRLSFPPREDGKAPINIVVGTGAGEDEAAAALLVDEIGDVIDIDPASCEPPPDTINGAVRDLIQSVCKLEKGLLLILDVAKATRIE